MADLSQKHLNNQVNLWLKEKRQEGYIDTEGDCLRRSIIWLLHAKKRLLNTLNSDYELISTWNGEDTNNKLDGAFKRFLALNDAMQRPGNLAHHIQPDKLSRHKKYDLPIPNLKVCDSKSLIWELEELLNFLQKEANEGEMFLINYSDHAYGFIRQNDTYYLYDPNEPSGVISCTDIYDAVRELMLRLDCDTKHIPLSIHKIYFEHELQPQKFSTNHHFKSDLSLKVSKDGATAAMLAAQNNDLATLQFLQLASQCIDQTDKQGMSALYLAAQNGHEECLSYLYSLGAAIDFLGPEKQTPLYVAAKNNHLNVCTRLLELGAAINLAAEDGTTPLHIAANNGNDNIVFNLIRLGADRNNQALEDGTSPLYVAAMNGHLNCVKILLQHSNIQVNIALFDDNTTSLHIACEKGYKDIVSELLQQPGINLDIANDNGETALHNACEGEHIDIVELLIAKGANVDHLNNDKITPLEIACIAKNKKVALALLRANANPGLIQNEENTLWLANLKIKNEQNNANASNVGGLGHFSRKRKDETESSSNKYSRYNRDEGSQRP